MLYKTLSAIVPSKTMERGSAWIENRQKRKRKTNGLLVKTNNQDLYHDSTTAVNNMPGAPSDQFLSFDADQTFPQI